jgi:alkylhydroperoxidase family enzyme
MLRKSKQSSLPQLTRRIRAVKPPYDTHTEALLAAMMPPGVPPIRLFRTFANNRAMTAAMHGWGSYELSKNLSLTMRQREIVVDRTCARCGCEYEWGVHVAFFADRVGLTREQISSLTHGRSTDGCWPDAAEQALIDAVDALHDIADIDDNLWRRLAAWFDDAQLLDLLLLCGWYHAISFAANAGHIDLEDGAPRFNDYHE